MAIKLVRALDSNSPEAMTVMRHAVDSFFMAGNVIPMRGSYYDPEPKILNKSLQLLKGYQIKVMDSSLGPLLNIDQAFRAVRDKTLNQEME